MKQFKTLTLALAALTMFSCQKENNSVKEDTTATKTMQISIAKGGVDKNSKAVGAPVAGSYKTPINGTIGVYCFDGMTDESVLVWSDKAVAVIESGETYEGSVTVPSSTKYVYVVANVPDQTSVPAVVNSTKLSEVKASGLLVKNYKLIDNAPMTNGATLNLNTGTTPWKLDLRIAPAMACIEIEKIEADNDVALGAADKITKFDIVAVHMNNYYTDFTLAGLTGKTLVTPVMDGTKLRGSTVEDWSYDLHPALGTSISYTDGWRYMLAPAQALANMPKIILELNNITINGVDLTGSRFVTVKSLLLSNVSITSLDRNVIYKLATIKFNGTHLSVVPNQENVSVDVIVTVEAWNQVGATPEL